MREAVSALFPAALAGRAAPASQIEAVLPCLPADILDVMAAARAAASAGGARPFTCGIINAKSGRCGEDCAFCAQSAHHNAAVKTHPLLPADALLARAEELSRAGVDYMGIVASGGGPGGADFDAICRTAERIRRSVPIKLCASLGILSADQAGSLRQAGFTSCHHNLETARTYYPAVCTTHAYDLRTETVRRAKAAGLRVCSGGLFGLGESWRQRLELAGELAGLDVDSIPVNFLTPIEGTPLAGAPGLDAGTALAIVAVLRLMHPGRDIVICGGRERTLGRAMPLLFSAGANGLMVGDYLTTRGSAFDEDMRMLGLLGMRG